MSTILYRTSLEDTTAHSHTPSIDTKKRHEEEYVRGSSEDGWRATISKSNGRGLTPRKRFDALETFTY
jgi:hypothetical protein